MHSSVNEMSNRVAITKKPPRRRRRKICYNYVKHILLRLSLTTSIKYVITTLNIFY